MKNHLFQKALLLFPVFLAHTVLSQSWSPVEAGQVRMAGQRDIVPQQYTLYHIDPVEIKSMLWPAPHETDASSRTSPVVVTVGLADGSADRFRIVAYDMMENGLAVRYPEIKTFRGISLSDPYRTIRIDWTTEGFRAVIRDAEGRTFIDPFQRHDLSTRIVYYAKDHFRENEWTCGTGYEPLPYAEENGRRAAGDCRFRSFRLAITTSGEYSNYFGATSPAQSPLVLSQIVTAVNRLNEVYEFDLSIRFLLVANTDAAFFYNAGTDPFSDDACANRSAAHNAIVAAVGNPNFDLGHMFGRGGGGCAALRVLCSNNNKGWGSTLQDPPVGDRFFIDYVAHEMGHQLGANHTQNNNCNRVLATAMEPGSASTIMGYAGICSPNVQNISDDYFHGISLQEMGNHISQSSCHQTISTANTAPTVNGGPDYTIPISTPFVLTATGTDAEMDALTYCWEQWDNAAAPMPPVHTSAAGPMFRSFRPTAGPSRYFPALQSLANNVDPAWEELPSVSRTMQFRVTVRDIHDNLYGCTGEDNVMVTTVASAGPFAVTSQHTPETWTEGSQQIITWNAANTTAHPVNCSHVDILLSWDGGMTFPVSLAERIPNNGKALVNIPAGTTTAGRIMVKASENIFFDINNRNIEITPGMPGFFINPDRLFMAACNLDTLRITVELSPFMDFTDTVTLSAGHLPDGVTAVFDPERVVPGTGSTLTLSGLDDVFGDYTITIQGTSGMVSASVEVLLSLFLSAPQGPDLVSPADHAADAPMTPLLQWLEGPEGTQYDIQVAADSSFGIIIRSGRTPVPLYQVTTPLAVGHTYYWRVRAVSDCGTGEWSPAFAFTTTSCFLQLSPDVPLTLPSTGGPSTTNSTLYCPVNLLIDDLDIVHLQGVHSRISDLRFYLVSPDNAQLLAWNRPCNNQFQDFDIHFDDQAPEGSWPCPPTDGNTYRPANALSFFSGRFSQGSWRLEVRDIIPLEGGRLDRWGLKICGYLGCERVVNQASGSGPGSLPAAILCGEPVDTILLSEALNGQGILIGDPVIIDKKVIIKSEGDVTLMGSGNTLFELLPGAELELSGVTIVAGTSPAINNRGILRLENITVEKSPGAPYAMVVRNTQDARTIVDGRPVISSQDVFAH